MPPRNCIIINEKPEPEAKSPLGRIESDRTRNRPRKSHRIWNMDSFVIPDFLTNNGIPHKTMMANIILT
ncbi:MAG: hypothetical protein SPL51_03295 [Lachnospiraceae bacterium]|nr:hypothetical protein [Lachnospiraceae bacterium]